MAQTLVRGQNIPINGKKIQHRIFAGNDADYSAFLLDVGGKTKLDEDFVFYGQTQSPEGAVKMIKERNGAAFQVDVAKIPSRIEKIAFTATSDGLNLSGLGSIEAALSGSGGELAQASAETRTRPEAALILCEIYRRNNAWKFRFVDQGFNGGLKPLAEYYGVEIADEPKPAPKPEPRPEPAPKPAPRPQPSPQPRPEPRTQPKPQSKPVNLSKITLTKSEPKVSLDKAGGGIWKVNLNWNQGSRDANVGGGLLGQLFGRKKPGGIDLDLGACVRLHNGDKEIIQALGGNFGSTMQPPFVQLMGDDRTGSSSDGEWIYINGSQFKRIRDIFIYAFIYDGVPNWSETDGVVRVIIPGQPEIETRMAEGDNSKHLCAIARIYNDGGDVAIERLDAYFRGQQEMDEAYGWGFAWRKGSK